LVHDFRLLFSTGSKVYLIVLNKSSIIYMSSTTGLQAPPRLKELQQEAEEG